MPAYYPSRLPARARRARAQLLGLISRCRTREDYPPEELLRVVEAAALDAAAKRLLLDPTGAPLDLSQEAAAGWRAGRAAAVLDLLAQAEQIAPPLPVRPLAYPEPTTPPPPRPAPLFCRSRPAPAREDDGPWTAWGTLDWGRDSAETPSG
ncbi:hypothetical protein [Streptomyces sp. NPDC058861]|uniref:hypothetical protein n=1 Tax=Streptomyces sp. NPDC058861 TaxID=3346653 RepID=UPI00367F5E54